MRDNRLTKEELEFIKRDKSQKNIYKFILNAHSNDKNFKYIYRLTLQSGQNTYARFNSEEFFDGIAYVTFCVLKTYFKNINDCIKKNKILVFNHLNFPIKYKLINDDSDYTLTLTTNQFCKFDFEGSKILKTTFNKINNELYVILTYFNSCKTKKIQISKKHNIDLFIKFEGIKYVNNIKYLESNHYKISGLKIKDWGLEFYSYHNDSDIDICNILPYISRIKFKRAVIKVIKDQKLYYSYVKNKYYFENDSPIINNIIKVAIEKKQNKSPLNKLRNSLL